MSVSITSLNSGSNGNCYYVGNDNEAVLVDVGISCKEVEKRMLRLGLSIRNVKAIFVSHEHSDHIKGICALVKKYAIPVYITSPTFHSCGLLIDQKLVRTININEPVAIGDLVITSFSKLHDACDPCSFIISSNGIYVGVFTDLGAPCKNLVKHFKLCHAAFLEANYDDEMLRLGNYPYHLKKRISGGYGHLSNKQALEVFTQHKPPFMTHLFLSHLSKNNNCPQLVQQLFNQHANGVKMIVASRYEETPVFTISRGIDTSKRKAIARSSQLAFSFT